ncbi:WD domain-containing protein [Colletotrichum graminicola]|uniref:WD domain-containing protein n=1 Tax=Colletotrichum graminicola (strain M1.001 / M2 / FGSC 10212) TaxID=645133 RepID=E3QQB7_COLGM|nr:WD domain-containing protein [Colletotrichum graminicola M1.001]EFQ33055.1 WD domain-containing protein [Colletotrichum graminicola M1.001]WDK22017.1 WD domain-containing protein [Colletotrichum graminicola]
MAAFVSQDPDEGYSEDPLNPGFGASQDVSSPSSSAAAAAAARPPADLPAWLVRHIPSLPVAARTELAIALLDNLPTSAVVQIVQRLHPRLYIDFVHYLPPEVCLKILAYLDPISLVNVAKACRAWHELALDRKLWEKLYHLEGWKALYPEIRLWEQKVNEGLNLSASSLHRVRSSEDGHTYKKRAISEDNDLEMTDAGVASSTGVREDSVNSTSSVFGTSIFGSPASSFTGFPRNSAAPQAGDMDVDRSSSGPNSRSGERGFGVDSKGKGTASPMLRAALVKEESLPPMIPADAPGGIARSTLWSWDAPSARYRVNWKYLYTMRRRLEQNWELGKFSNFQLPHPDHLNEGHQECIYSLQYDSEYLVSGSRDKTIRIWSMHTRRLLRKPLEGHTGSVLCLQFDSDPEEDLIVSGSSDSDVILWRFSTGQIIQRLKNAHTESVLNVKFDKRILVTCSKDKSIKIFNRRPLKYGDAGYGDVDVVFSAPTHLRNYGYANPLDELPVKPPYTMIGVLEGHGAAVNAVQICDNEVVSASGDRNIKVWDWAKQVCIRTVVGHGKGIACVQYDGRRIVSGSSDNEVKVFDRTTGLEVASLRAHTNLVRTVQAGFGDLPYSAAEDRAEARRIDEQYFKAIEDGIITPFSDHNRSRRAQPRNAGSRRPEDITAYGAALPPGGGGGKYARIVSGSYDQSIIIWRRDKEGVWKDTQHLRQEDAAAAAQAQARATSQAPAEVMPAEAMPTETVPTEAVPAAPNQSALRHLIASRAARQGLPAASARAAAGAAVLADAAPAFMHLIDTVVPQGPTQLRQALHNHPNMVAAYRAHIQAAIGREPNSRIRDDLRGVLNAALLEAHINQSRGLGGNREGPTIVPPALPSLAPAAAGTAAGTSSAANVPQVQGHLHIQGQGQPAQPTQPGAPIQAQATPVPVQGAQNAIVPDAVHHPHIANGDNGPARVFKLQYDARRIICCSQTTVIVGWDFCNNDPELEEVARFFGTVE